MVVGAFPVAKLGALLLKTVSKPLANVVKRRAKTSPFFRTYICMPPAQFYHWCEIKLKMWTMNLGKPVNIPKLNENMAIELGAELVGEGIIFTIAAGILIAEYIRSSNKETVKEEQRLEELNRIQNELRELYFSKAESDAQIRELIRIVHIHLPKANFNPQAQSLKNIETIPEHHRRDGNDEEASSSGIWNGVKSVTWSLVETFIPSSSSSSSSPSDIKTTSIFQKSTEVVTTKKESNQQSDISDKNNNNTNSQDNNKIVSKSMSTTTIKKDGNSSAYDIEIIKLSDPPQPAESLQNKSISPKS